MDTRCIRYPAHKTAQSHYFPDNVTLADSPHCRVARLRHNPGGVLRKKQGLTAEPDGRVRSLAACMTTTDDNNIKHGAILISKYTQFFKPSHTSLPFPGWFTYLHMSSTGVDQSNQ
jgi:hypothetical protein